MTSTDTGVLVIHLDYQAPIDIEQETTTLLELCHLVEHTSSVHIKGHNISKLQ